MDSAASPSSPFLTNSTINTVPHHHHHQHRSSPASPVITIGQMTLIGIDR
ncbi:unnamed protein product [Cylicostephanus goldi]|uniref:Uncharacterized protein n=1 Tax=Cylicostephanus goldi TaxID=71465 RepID=A0A3P6UWA8_CYLGO|nr:unnamed protein product [Cylicostephanus goldi]